MGCGVSVGLHGEPGQRAVGGGLGTCGLNQRGAACLNLCREVLPGDGVLDQVQMALRRAGQAGGKPVDGVTLCGRCCGDGGSGAGHAETVGLIGPEVGGHAQQVVRARGVQRIEVYARAGRNLGAGSGGQGAVPVWREGHGRHVRAKAGIADVEGVVIPHHVEPAAGPKLGEVNGQVEILQCHMCACDEGCGAAHLVGLGRAVCPVEEEGFAGFEGCENGVSEISVVRFVGRVMAGEVRGCAAEDQSVQAAGDAQGNGMASGAEVAGEGGDLLAKRGGFWPVVGQYR